MHIKSVPLTIGKLLIGTFAFFVGAILGGIAAGLLGIPQPVMPANIDPATAAQSMPLVGILMTMSLAFLSKRSGAGFFPRWISLGLFSWTAYGFNNYLEARFFSPDVATSYLLVFNFVACFSCSAAVAWLFKPTPPAESVWTKTRAFFAVRPFRSWAWRFFGALAAFPIAYFVFGWLVSPFVVSFYEQQYAGLVLPGLEVMLLLSIIRSLFFLLCTLPVLILWKGSRKIFFLALGVTLFLFVGGLNMVQAIWLPAILRTAHSLEILADSFAHAAALVFLLVPGSLVALRSPERTHDLEAARSHVI